MNKKQYIEIKVLNTNKLILSIIFYPVIALVGIAVVTFNLMRFASKLLGYLIISLIPVMNTSILNENFDNLSNAFDRFYNSDSEFLNNLYETKQIEIKTK
jgi:hypothetical protein